MSLFEGIADAEVFEQGNYFEPGGKYRLMVNRILLKDTQRSGMGFIVEFKVLRSSLPDKHAIGSKGSWFQGMTDKKVALPAIKEFMAALCKVNLNNPEEKEEFNSSIEEILKEATAEFEGGPEKHPFHGMQVDLETWSKVTQKGNDFTVHKWIIIPEGEEDEVA